MSCLGAETESRPTRSRYQRLFSWGANSYGQLAQGDNMDLSEPREAAPIDHRVLSITGGGGHTLAVTESGQLLTCGSNNCGQLGQEDLQDCPLLRPVAALRHLRIVMVTGGWDFTLALTEDGAVLSWGNNAFGQLGRPEVTKYTSQPGEVKFSAGAADAADAARICHLVAGMRHALAVTGSGRVFAWGWGKKGQLGVVDQGKPLPSSPRPLPVPLGEGVAAAREVFAGSHHSGAVTGDGRVLVWGLNKWGQTSLSPQQVQQLPQPHAVPAQLLGGERVQRVASGWSHCVALTESGRLLSWGRSDLGQLGREAEKPCDPAPSLVETAGAVLSLQCGSEHCLVLTEKGAVQMWGWNEHGTCGTGGTTDVGRPRTVEVGGGRGPVCLVGTGAGHAFALVEAGGLDTDTGSGRQDSS